MKNEAHVNHTHQDQGPHQHGGHAFSDPKAFERMAEKFESPQRDLEQKPEEIIRYMGDLKGKMIMDIGAATGYFSVRFAREGARVIAADVSPEFQAYLQKRIEQNRIENVQLRLVRYDSPLLEKAEVDLVFVANTYHHIENRIDYFAQVREGLKPGGELVIVDYLKSQLPKDVMAPPMEMRVSVDEVLFELKSAGFNYFEIEGNTLPYQYIIRAK